MVCLYSCKNETFYKKYTHTAYLAQLVEHPSHTRIVTSSSLVVGKINKLIQEF